MPFEFGSLTTQTKKKEIGLNKKNPILFTDIKSNKMVVFLFDGFYPQSLLNAFKIWIRKSLPNHSILGLSTVLVDIKSDELTQIVDFYSRLHIDFNTYLKEYEQYEKVYVTLGRAIYAVTESDDISIEDFYDFIFNKTYFYSPKLKAKVFPIDHPTSMFKDSLQSWMPADRARTHFAEFQFKCINNNFDFLVQEAKKDEPYYLTFFNTKEEVSNFFLENKEYSSITAYDIETDSFDFYLGHIGCITLSLDGINGYYLPIELIDINQFADFMMNKKIIGQNLKFDNKFIRKLSGKSLYVYSDTMVLAQTLCEFRRNSLKSLAWYYTTLGGYDSELEEFKKKFKIKTYLDIPTPILAKYASLDPVVTFRAYREMSEQLESIDKKFPPKGNGKTIKYFYEEIMMPSYREFIDIEYEGMYVNKENHEKLTQRILTDLEVTKKFILETLLITNEDFNLDSSKQLGIHIENALKWKNYGRNKAGEYLTGDEQIVRWVKDGNSGAKELQKYRSLSTLLKTFMGHPGTTEGWREYFREHSDGSTRIHAKFGIGVAESKRNTCRDPNLQQMPAHGTYAKDFKKIMDVPPTDNNGDYLFGSLDYASLQIRLCAIDSQDKTLCNIYKSDPDPDLHSTTGYDLIKASNYTFIQFEDKGTKYELYELQPVLVLRRGEELEVLAKNILDSDEFIKVV